MKVKASALVFIKLLLSNDFLKHMRHYCSCCHEFQINILSISRLKFTKKTDRNLGELKNFSIFVDSTLQAFT